MNTTSETSKAPNGLRVNAIFMIVVLVIQYVLGMVANLFVKFPDTNQPDQLWAAARSQFPTMAHIVVGTLLLVGAVVFVIRATRNHHRSWIASSVAGLIAILAALFGGVTFTTTQVDGYSLLMAIAAIAAFVAYGWGLYASRK